MNTTKLPALEGSEKQVAWAEKIRSFLLGEMKRILEVDRRSLATAIELAEKQSTPARLAKVEKFGAVVAISEQVIEFCSQQTSAKWWIKRQRYSSYTSFARDMEKANA